MKISKIQNIDLDKLVVAIVSHFNDSRFSVDVSQSKGSINLKNVRLKQSKEYCGNHPKGCEATGGPKHKKAAFLEGADWVEFNDRLNDVLDRMNVSAVVASSVCNIRQGDARRVKYDAKSRFPNGTWAWDKFGEADHYRHSVSRSYGPSEFPMGTPGIYESVGYNVVG